MGVVPAPLTDRAVGAALELHLLLAAEHRFLQQQRKDDPDVLPLGGLPDPTLVAIERRKRGAIQDGLHPRRPARIIDAAQPRVRQHLVCLGYYLEPSLRLLRGVYVRVASPDGGSVGRLQLPQTRLPVHVQRSVEVALSSSETHVASPPPGAPPVRAATPPGRVGAVGILAGERNAAREGITSARPTGRKSRRRQKPHRLATWCLAGPGT
mmetsp:Transcript_13891/g.39336  ORF Transcript_13891/g.39336 Transcript_13891/m.39336 type:complete len:210 (+) Transcript_13891:1058-1687(+)